MRTFGVEEELLLVDERTGVPLPLASRVLARHADDTAGADGIGLEAELQQEMIEVITAPQSSLASLTDQIRAGRSHADACAVLVGARAVAVGSSPMPARPHPTRKSRYALMVRRYGILARDCLVCGMHTHVSIASREEGVAVLDRIRNWLPVLIALGANSPFVDGEDTGHASHRSVAWREWPCAGPTDLFGSVAAYDAFEQQLLASGVILDSGMLYFDARLSRNHPTVEVRVSDACLRADDAAVIAALTRGLVETAARQWREGEQPAPVPTALLRLATWKAALSGVGEQLVHPLSGRSEPARVVVDALMTHVRDTLREIGDLAAVESGVERILRDGTGADLQRSALTQTGGVPGIVRRAVELTHEGRRALETPAPR